MSVNLELYRFFYTVARCGSLTKAAQELFISQPAISQSIKLLEQQIGGALFVRTAKGMELTYEGKVIYDYIERAYELVDAAESKFAQLKNLKFGCFTIGANDTLCKNFLLKHICRFNKLYPDVKIQMTNRPTVDTIKLLKNSKADIGFVNLPADTAGLNVEECFKINDIFVCDGRRYGQIKAPLPIEEIAALPLIAIERTSTTRMSVDNFFADRDITLKPVFELSSHELVVEFAKAGLGVGCVVREFVGEELKNGTLFELPLTESLPTRGIGLVTLKDAPIKFAAKRFAEMIIGDA
ncbi:MAG: LysR family transcriptional regulator [Clostridiales bacterium]|jgi:DNA-binding transcriptional LysR family regulator|nr:LysR family transcriptional regulator [Clostridiales bacterium]